eukprot:2404466-Rhodomonas_salina.1
MLVLSWWYALLPLLLAPTESAVCSYAQGNAHLVDSSSAFVQNQGLMFSGTNPLPSGPALLTNSVAMLCSSVQTFYPMSGTGIPYGPVPTVSGTDLRTSGLSCYAVSGTDLGYPATRPTPWPAAPGPWKRCPRSAPIYGGDAAVYGCLLLFLVVVLLCMATLTLFVAAMRPFMVALLLGIYALLLPMLALLLLLLLATHAPESTHPPMVSAPPLVSFMATMQPFMAAMLLCMGAMPPFMATVQPFMAAVLLFMGVMPPGMAATLTFSGAAPAP